MVIKFMELIGKRMKKIYFNVILALIVFISVFTGYSQVPKAFNYQAVLRNTLGASLASQNIGLRLTIRADSANGVLEYSERQFVKTNQFGLYSVQVGRGSVLSGNFAGITWSNGKKWLVVEIDITGGSNYVLSGSSELLSVPYALY